MDPDPLYELIGEAMSETPQVKLDMAIKSAFDALDEITAMAADPLTKHLVEADKIAVAQLISRAELIAQFILKYPASPAFRARLVTSNG